MDFVDKVKTGISENKRSCAGVAALLIVSIVFIAFVTSKHEQKKVETKSGFLDYMPDVPRPCPSDYRCGGISREQVKMENRLYTDLREGSKYALPETMTMDAYDVIASEAEPTSCMLKRAGEAKETSMPEGQYTPWDEIESGFLARAKKKSSAN